MLRDQERALSAYQRVKARRSLKTEYVAIARSVSSLIHSAGLLQAIEFLNSRKDSNEKGKAAKDFLNDLAKTVLHPHYSVNKPNESQISKDDFIGVIRDADFKKYLFLTRETLAVCKWYRRYAESIVDDRPAQEAENSNTDIESEE